MTATGAAWRGGRGDKAALPRQLRCLLRGGGTLTLGFAHRIQSHAGPLGPAAGRRRTRRGTRCPLGVTDSNSLKPTESQTRAAPAPISSMQATHLSQPTGAKQPEGCRAEACGKCSPSWESLGHRSRVRRRGRGCEGLEASGCDLGSSGRARRLRCPLHPNPLSKLSSLFWGLGCCPTRAENTHRHIITCLIWEIRTQ